MKFDGDVSEGSIEGHNVLLLKPMTFMNDSGKSVGAVARFLKIPPSRIVVFHDELDLAPGKIRAKTGGGVAGHNGLKSIARHLSKDFRRVRIGIGHPGERDLVTGHVLRDFAMADMVWVDKTIEAIAEASPHLVADKESEFTSKVALILKPPGQKKAPRDPKQDDQGSDR